jgi:hypothetical protein
LKDQHTNHMATCPDTDVYSNACFVLFYIHFACVLFMPNVCFGSLLLFCYTLTGLLYLKYSKKKVLQEDVLELTTARLEDQHSNHMATGPNNLLCSNAWFVVLCMPNVCFDFFVIVYVLLRTYNGCYIILVTTHPS